MTSTSPPGPRDPIAAVTYPDPYPYYRQLAATAPLAFHPVLDMWIAAGADAVTAVLTCDRCAVRPPGEPVPAPLVGTIAGDLFRRLVRTRDGDAHHTAKARLGTTLARITPARIAEAAPAIARAMPDELRHPRGVTAFARRFPVAVVASLLGVPTAALPSTAAAVDDLVAAFRPGAPATARADAAAVALLDRVSHELGRTDDAANAIGLLIQSCEATAALLGNTVVALGRSPGPGTPDAIAAVVAEVLRADPPVHNTRRFATADVGLLGQSVRRGDTILVVLVSAPFGRGPHMCPGDGVASAIAAAGVQHLLAAGVDPVRCLDGLAYQPSINVRMPDFGGAS